MEINFSGWEKYHVYGSINVEPKDFLDCEDEEELMDAIHDVMYEASTESSDYIDGDIGFDNDVSEEFIEEWRRAKAKFGDAELTENAKSDFDKLLDELIEESN